jgi:hypothetical protein
VERSAAAGAEVMRLVSIGRAQRGEVSCPVMPLGRILVARDVCQASRDGYHGCPVDTIGGRCVPVVHRFGPYGFYFFSNENRATHERPHIHVRSGDGEAVFWLTPVSLRSAWGYTPREVERVRRIVIANRDLLLGRWHEFFDEGT